MIFTQEDCEGLMCRSPHLNAETQLQSAQSPGPWLQTPVRRALRDRGWGQVTEPHSALSRPHFHWSRPSAGLPAGVPGPGCQPSLCTPRASFNESESGGRGVTGPGQEPGMVSTLERSPAAGGPGLCPRLPLLQTPPAHPAAPPGPLLTLTAFHGPECWPFSSGRPPSSPGRAPGRPPAGSPLPGSLLRPSLSTCCHGASEAREGRGPQGGLACLGLSLG